MIASLVRWWNRGRYDTSIHLDRGDVISLLTMAAQLDPDDFDDRETKHVVNAARNLAAFVREHPDCRIGVTVSLSSE